MCSFSLIITPGTPLYCGVSERRIQTLLNLVRSIMIYSSLPGFVLEICASNGSINSELWFPWNQFQGHHSKDGMVRNRFLTTFEFGTDRPIILFGELMSWLIVVSSPRSSLENRWARQPFRVMSVYRISQKNERLIILTVLLITKLFCYHQYWIRRGRLC